MPRVFNAGNKVGFEVLPSWSKRFVSKGHGRVQGRKESRTEWCVVRQRQWYVRPATGESLISSLPEKMDLEFGEVL